MNKRIMAGYTLFTTSVRVLLEYPAFWVYTLLMLGILYTQRYLMPVTNSGQLNIIVILLFSCIKTLLSAFIVHQAMNLPGGTRPSPMQTLRTCYAHARLLLLVVLIEPIFVGISLVVHNPGYRILIVLVWYVITLTILPLIFDTTYTLRSLLRQSWVITQKIWIESAIAAFILIIGLESINQIIMGLASRNFYQSMPAHLLVYGSLNSIRALLIVTAMILRAVAYRYANRNRLLELSELQSPYF